MLSLVVPILDLNRIHETQSITEIETRSATATDIPRVYGMDLSTQLAGQFSAFRFRELIREFTQNGSRVIGSLNNLYAHDWILKMLDNVSNGRIETEVLGDHQSIVGHLPGWLPGEHPVLMIGGHYDSVADAPGANDDGTGVITMLEVARVMCQYEWPLDIYFCAWNAEEIGLVGSDEVAAILADRGIKILQYYNIDMLLIQDQTAAPDERLWFVYNDGSDVRYGQSQYYADLARAMSNNLGLNLIRTIPARPFTGWQHSDHYSFVSHGYDNVLFAFESGFLYDSYYHQPTDQWNNTAYNYTLGQETAMSIATSMAFIMSGSYGSPLTMTFSGELAAGETRQYYVPIDTNTTIEFGIDWTGGSVEVSMESPDCAASECIKSKASSGHLFSDIPSNNTMGLWNMIAHNNGETNIEFTITVRFETDFDTNGVIDSKEYWMNQALFTVDNDYDGMSNGLEIIIGTSPWDSDSDSDSMPDGWEWDNSLNPLLNDSALDADHDGLINLQEYILGTNPQNNDSDGDQMPDGYEVMNDLDPLSNDAHNDPDFDGFDNIVEYEQGTNPHGMDFNPAGPLARIGIICIITVVAGAVTIHKKLKIIHEKQRRESEKEKRIEGKAPMQESSST